MAGVSELEKAVDKLIRREKGWSEFKRPAAVGARPGAVTTGRPSASGSQSAAAFEESDYLLREYWPDRLLTSTDGLFTWYEQPIKKIALKGNAVALFAEPVEPAP